MIRTMHTRYPQSLERRGSGLVVPPVRSMVPTSLEELKALIKLNPWYDPDLKRKLNGNHPRELAGIDPDFGGKVASPMNSLGFQETLMYSTIAGPAKASWTSAVTALNPTEIVAFPANYFKRLGQMLRITVKGALGNLVTTPGLVSYEVRLGPTSNNLIFTTSTIQLNATAHTLLPFNVDILMTLRATGITTSANFAGQGVVTGVQYTKTAAQVDQVNNGHSITAPATAPAVGAGFDSTIANLLDFYVGMSISDAANTTTVHQYLVESLN